MRPLLDESVPGRLRRALPGHHVRTVGEAGWSGVKNGKLLAIAAIEFDVFVTVDKNMPFQQNHLTLPIAVAVMHAASNELEFLLPLVPRLEVVLASITTRAFFDVKADT